MNTCLQHHLSDSQEVFLRNVNLEASGTYKCEVSAEAPLFTSVHGEGRMEVVGTSYLFYVFIYFIYLELSTSQATELRSTEYILKSGKKTLRYDLRH